MVCPEDYEPKEPQIEPLQYKGDAIALKDPRPDRTEPLTVVVNSAGATLLLRQYQILCSLLHRQ